MAFLLQYICAEAMKGVDISRVPVAGQVMDPGPHLVGRLVGEGHAQNIPGRYADLVHQIGEAMGKGPGLAAARTGDHPDIALRGRHRRKLFIIQIV